MKDTLSVAQANANARKHSIVISHRIILRNVQDRRLVKASCA